MPLLLFLNWQPKTHRHGNCYSDTMTPGGPNNAGELEDLETQVQKARQLVRQSELKVEAIEASIHEIEKFYPKIKIVGQPDAPHPAAEGTSSILAENALLKTA